MNSATGHSRVATQPLDPVILDFKVTLPALAAIRRPLEMATRDRYANTA